MVPRQFPILITAALFSFYQSPRAAWLAGKEADPVIHAASTFQIRSVAAGKDGVCLESESTIHAAMPAVVTAATDFARQPAIFEGYKSIRAKQTSAGRWRVSYVETVPVLPDTKYTLDWELVPGAQTVLRYRLSNGDDIKDAEGFMQFREVDHATIYHGIDCFTPTRAMRLFRGRVIDDARAQTAQEDSAMFLLAEHPEWSNDRIRDEAAKAAKTATTGR